MRSWELSSSFTDLSCVKYFMMLSSATFEAEMMMTNKSFSALI